MLLLTLTQNAYKLPQNNIRNEIFNPINRFLNSRIDNDIVDVPIQCVECSIFLYIFGRN